MKFPDGWDEAQKRDREYKKEAAMKKELGTKEGIFFGNEFIEELELQGYCYQCGDLVDDENEAYSVTTEMGERFFCCFECYQTYTERFGDMAFDI